MAEDLGVPIRLECGDALLAALERGAACPRCRGVEDTCVGCGGSKLRKTNLVMAETGDARLLRAFIKALDESRLERLHRREGGDAE